MERNSNFRTFIEGYRANVFRNTIVLQGGGVGFLDIIRRTLEGDEKGAIAIGFIVSLVIGTLIKDIQKKGKDRVNNQNKHGQSR